MSSSTTVPSVFISFIYVVMDVPPSYDWTDSIIRYSKQSRMKKNTGQPMELTERQYNESIGLSRIWDCGKIRWVYS